MRGIYSALAALPWALRPVPAPRERPRPPAQIRAPAAPDGLEAHRQCRGPAPFQVVRTIDGDTFEARARLRPGLEMTTRVLRGIDAPELKASCPRMLEMAEAASAAMRGARRLV